MSHGTPAQQTGSSGVRIERERDVLRMTLDNAAAANAITGAMFDAMLAALQGEAARPTARVLHIRAEGDVFCMGRERAGKEEATIRAEVARLIAFKDAVRRSPLISVAEVQGNAAGFGVGLAVVCDFTVVAETAVLSFPEMRHGLPPAAIMAYLGRYAPLKRIFPLILLATDFTASHARDIGLVTHVTSREALRGEVEGWIGRILAMDAEAVRQCKAYFQAAQEASIDENFAKATELLTMRTLALQSARTT